MSTGDGVEDNDAKDLFWDGLEGNGSVDLYLGRCGGLYS